MISKYKSAFYCLSILLLNLILKLLFVTYTDVSLDEPFSIYHSQKSITGIFQLLKTENNPPLFFIILHYWIDIFGIDEFSVRLPSVIFSSLSSVLIFIIGNKYFSFRIGIISSLLFSSSTLQMFYAHDARVYALFFALSCINLYFFIDQTIFRVNNNRILFWLTIVNILLCYSHFFGFVIVLTELFIAFLLFPFQKVFWRNFLSVALIFISYLWYIPTVFERYEASTQGNWIPSPLISDLYTMIWRFSNMPVIAVLFIFTLIIGASVKWHVINLKNSTSFKIILFQFLLCYFGIFIISFWIPLFIDRYLLFTSLYFYLLLGIIFNSLFVSKFISNLLIPIPIILMFLTLELKKGKKDNYQELVKYVNLIPDSTYSIIITPEWSDLNFVYYYDRNLFKVVKNFKDSLFSHSIYPVNNIEQLPIQNENKSIILIDNNYNNEALKKFLMNNFTLEERKIFNKTLDLYYFTSKNKFPSKQKL